VDLFEYFSNKKPRKLMNKVHDADVIDEILKNHHLSYISIDRERLSDSWESWAYVNIIETPSDNIRGILDRFGKRKGVLTWENSD
jgi:hypothetical protein